MGNGHSPEVAGAPEAFGQCCQGCTAGIVRGSGQGQELDSITLVGPFHLRIFHNSMILPSALTIFSFCTIYKSDKASHSSLKMKLTALSFLCSHHG